MTYAVNDGHCASSAVPRSSSPSGTWISRTNRVIAIAKTPSAKVSSRPVSSAGSVGVGAVAFMDER